MWRKRESLSSPEEPLDRLSRGPAPLYAFVRLLAPEEATEARAQARKEYEKVLPAASVSPPPPEQLDKWYGTA